MNNKKWIFIQITAAYIRGRSKTIPYSLLHNDSFLLYRSFDLREDWLLVVREAKPFRVVKPGEYLIVDDDKNYFQDLKYLSIPS